MCSFSWFPPEKIGQIKMRRLSRFPGTIYVKTFGPDDEDWQKRKQAGISIRCMLQRVGGGGAAACP